jgi:hypothetical protein
MNTENLENLLRVQPNCSLIDTAQALALLADMARDIGLADAEELALKACSQYSSLSLGLSAYLLNDRDDAEQELEGLSKSRIELLKLYTRQLIQALENGIETVKQSKNPRWPILRERGLIFNLKWQKVSGTIWI